MAHALSDGHHSHCYPFKISRKARLWTVIAISFSFFIAEISVGVYTKSLALVADAFHYLNDLVAFVVALTAVHVSEREEFPEDLSYGYARAQPLGAFFNGAFLFALGLSIIVQSIHRFIIIEHVENPKCILIIGCIGLGLNLVSALFLHEHDHGNSVGFRDNEEDIGCTSAHTNHLHSLTRPQKNAMDVGVLGILTHVLCDAINNIGVIVSAAIIWFVKSPSRYYADPAVSVCIAIMIIISAFPLTKQSGKILLQSTPHDINIQDVKRDLESIPGVESVHELHVWRLNQQKAIASAHIVVSDLGISSFMEKAVILQQCLHAYGVHSSTLQPELKAESLKTSEERDEKSLTITSSMSSSPTLNKCELPCLGSLCEHLRCCSSRTIPE